MSRCDVFVAVSLYKLLNKQLNPAYGAHWNWNKMANILQTIFWIAFCWMKKMWSFIYFCWMSNRPGPWFNIKMSSYQYRKSHCGDKTVVRSSYLHNGISYTGKMTSLYWFSPQKSALDLLWLGNGLASNRCWAITWNIEDPKHFTDWRIYVSRMSGSVFVTQLMQFSQVWVQLSRPLFKCSFSVCIPNLVCYSTHFT